MTFNEVKRLTAGKTVELLVCKRVGDEYLRWAGEDACVKCVHNVCVERAEARQVVPMQNRFIGWSWCVAVCVEGFGLQVAESEGWDLCFFGLQNITLHNRVLEDVQIEWV